MSRGVDVLTISYVLRILSLMSTIILGGVLMFDAVTADEPFNRTNVIAVALGSSLLLCVAMFQILFPVE